MLLRGFDYKQNMHMPRIVLVLVVILTACIFALDLNTPLGWATPVLYVLPSLLLAVWTPPSLLWPLFGLAIVCTVLILVALVLSPPGDIDVAHVNRFLTLCVLWGSVLIALIRKGAEQDTAHNPRWGTEHQAKISHPR
jgi:hypothetical protein